MMKLSLNPKEAIELLIHLEQSRDCLEEGNLMDGVRQRLKLYIISVLSAGDYKDYKTWATQTQNKIETLQKQNDAVGDEILKIPPDDPNEPAERKYPKMPKTPKKARRKIAKKR